MSADILRWIAGFDLKKTVSGAEFLKAKIHLTISINYFIINKHICITTIKKHII